MSFIRIGTVALWILCAACFLLPITSAAVAWGRTLFWVLLFAHAAEFLIFQKTLRAAPGSLGHHFVQTMIYGIFHVRAVKDSAPDPATAG